jgi:uncharacterized protein with WD repeat
VSSVAYSPDGSRLASASQDGTVKQWDAHSGAEVATLRGHTGGVTSVAYSPDGMRLASAAGDKTVKLWDAQSGAVLATLRGHTDWVSSVAYSPDGSRLASTSASEIKLWDAQSGIELASLRGHTGEVSSVAYSPDGTRLASASASEIKLWDTKSRAELATLRGHTGRVSSVAYSPDGSRLASASNDKTVKLWDAQSGAELATLHGHTGFVLSVVCSPDGTRLASASEDQTLTLWDARSGAELATLGGHTGEVSSVAYSPDGIRLFRRHPRPGDDPWDEDLQRRRAHTPAWHEEQAAAAAKAGERFATEFHRRRREQGDNLRLRAGARLAGGDEQGCLRALEQLRQRQRLLASLAPAAPLFAALAAGPTPGLLSATVVSPLEGERQRLAAQLVRAAAVVPEGGIPAAELVALARCCTAAEPHRWQARELLGAALYRDGQAEAAVRELTEAVRGHGRGGSLWAKLFLALAHRRLGHPEQAQQYRRLALVAPGWEEGVLQAQLLHELDNTLSEILAGRAKPTSAAQAADLARLCGSSLKRYVAATRLYEQAFTADPRLLEDFSANLNFEHCYVAACWAAWAAAGQGNDAARLGAPERARLRRQAHDWLRADLQHWTKTLQDGTPEGSFQVILRMQLWQRGADFAGVRDKQALAALPEPERRQWEQLWADVAALLDRALKAR